jgi:hypothetical protein
MIALTIIVDIKLYLVFYLHSFCPVKYKTPFYMVLFKSQGTHAKFWLARELTTVPEPSPGVNNYIKGGSPPFYFQDFFSNCDCLTFR